MTLATVHAAKGLEWQVVLVCGLEGGHAPLPARRAPPRRMEEERRLAYVAGHARQAHARALACAPPLRPRHATVALHRRGAQRAPHRRRRLTQRAGPQLARAHARGGTRSQEDP